MSAAPAAVGEAAPRATSATSPAPAPTPRTKPSQPPASVSLTPRALPTATGRIAAAGAAAAAAIVTAWTLGAGVGLTELLTLTAAPLLLFLTVMLGLRARAILTIALLSGALGVAAMTLAGRAGLATQTPLILVPGVMLIFIAFAFIVWSSPDVRLLGSALIIGLLAAIVATAWPVLVLLGVQRLIAGGHARPLVAAIATPLLTWLAAAFGRPLASQTGVTFSALRDGAFRVLILVAALAASLWAGASLEARFASAAISTPLESLTPTIGWAAAVGTFAPLVWMAWWLPGWLVRTQLRGRIEALAVGEPLTFLTFAPISALALWRVDSTIPPGRACWIALAGGAAYAYCRLRYAAPLPAPNAPLWIVIVGNDLYEMDDVVSNIADAWRAGQVTVLAVPAAASKVGGEHVQAAIRADQDSALFPRRLVHLQDWDDAQPPLWTAMPVRELYAVPELWPKILAERLDASCRIVALLRETRDAEAAPESLAGKAARIFRFEELRSLPTRGFFDSARRWGQGVLDRMRRATPTPRVLALLIPRSNGPSLRPDLSQPEVERLADEVIAGREPLADRLRTLQPKPAPVVVRHVIIQCARGQLEFADKLAERLHGAQDRDGSIVESWVSPPGGDTADLWRLASMPVGVWRHASIVLARLIEIAISVSGSGSFQAVMRLAATLLERHWRGEFEVVVVESPGREPATGLPPALIELGRRRGIIARVLAVRTPVAEASASLAYPPSFYAGQIRVPAGRPTDVAVGVVADKLLALDFLSVETPPATVATPAAEQSPAQITAALPPQSWLASCVQLELLGRPDPICVAFAVDETLAVSARGPIGPVPILGVAGGPGQLAVLRSRDDEIEDTSASLDALIPVGAERERFATTLSPGTGTDDDFLQAAVAGFVAGASRWYGVTLGGRTTPAGRARHGAIVDPPNLPPEDLGAAFTGAPVVARERVVGVIVHVTAPQPNQSLATVEIATAAYLNEVVQRGKSHRDALHSERAGAPSATTPAIGPLIYISYRTQDERVARRIRDALGDDGPSVVLHSSLMPSEIWQQSALRALDRSVVFVTILSSQVFSSGAIVWEWGEAERLSLRTGSAPRSRFIVPIVVDDLSPSDERIPPFIRDLQWVSAPNGELPPSVIERIRTEFSRYRRGTRQVADEPSVPDSSVDDSFVVLLPISARAAVSDLLHGVVSVIVASGSRQSALEEMLRAVQRAAGRSRRHIVVDIPSWPVSGWQLVRQIAESAGLDIGNISMLDIEPLPLRPIVEWLVSGIQRGEPSPILTLRGFDRAALQNDVADLVGELILRCTGPSTSLRLMLMNYTPPLPMVADDSRVVHVTLDPVGRTEVSSFLTALLERTGRQHGPDLINRATERVFEALDAGSWEYSELRERLRQVVGASIDPAT
jgi:hypothetical protein